jgi:hypothetical protein
MREPNDWRLTNQLNYFKGVDLAWRRYRAYREGWEHDHCEFCFSEFAHAKKLKFFARAMRPPMT